LIDIKQIIVKIETENNISAYEYIKTIDTNVDKMKRVRL